MIDYHQERCNTLMITDVLIADSFSIQTLHMTISFNIIKQQSKKNNVSIQLKRSWIKVSLSPKLKKAIINNISLYYKYSDDKNTNQQYNTTQDNLYNNCIKIKQILDGVTSSAVASSSLPIVANYCKTNKVGRRYSARNWIKILITNLLSIHNNA